MNKRFAIWLLLSWSAHANQAQTPLLLADSSFTRAAQTGNWQLDNFREYQYDEQRTLVRRSQWVPIPGFSSQRLLRSQTSWDTLPGLNTWRQVRNQFFYGAPPTLMLRTQIQQREEKQYNADNQLVTYVDLVQLQDWELGTLQGSAARFLYAYNPDGCIERRLRQACSYNQNNANMLPWQPEDEVWYQYEQDCLPAQVLRNTWDEVLEAWIPQQESRYTYRENGQPLSHLVLSPDGDTLYTETWQYNTFGEVFLYEALLSDGTAIQDRYGYGQGGMLASRSRYERPAPDSSWQIQWTRKYTSTEFLQTELFQVFRDGDTATVLTRELDARHLNAEGQVARAEYLLEVYEETNLQLQVLRHYERAYEYPCTGLPASRRTQHWLGYVSQGITQALPPDERESYRWDVSIYCENSSPQVELFLFPNPAHGQVRLYSEHLQEGSRIRLLDMQGRILQTYQAGAHWVHELFLPELVSGMYILQLERHHMPPLTARLIVLSP
jgi:hypothetical protein